MRVEEMPQFVRTSGSTRIPIVPKKSGRRAHITGISLNLAFTLDAIRLGIDFGENAYRHKIAYYRLLADPDFGHTLSRLAELRYCFCDTVWYYHIRNKKEITEVLLDNDKYRRDLQLALEETQLMEETKRPITGNKYLIVKIYDRNSATFDKILENLPKRALNMVNELKTIVYKIAPEYT